MISGMELFSSTEAAVDFLLARVEGPLRLGTPLGLGKPNPLLNAIYARFTKDPRRELEIYTALSLDPPAAAGFLAERFYGPFLKRHFGESYPELRYLEGLKTGRAPANIRVHEFYLQAGQGKSRPAIQRRYISLNYTHAASGLLDRGLNAIVQLVARGPDGRLSLSCNPDMSLDIDDLARARGKKIVKIGVVHGGLPFLEGDAAVDDSFFDAILEAPENHHELFALPRMPIDAVSHAIALHASTLVEDGGTLQIGIGSLSEALTHALLLRHGQNEKYRKAAAGTGRAVDNLSPFKEGLFGLSEMVMDGFMHLRKGGVLMREVNLRPDFPAFLQGAFFLGSKPFYAWLRELPAAERGKVFMSRVSRVNDLYDPDENKIRRQRPKARFFNTAMRVNLLGASVSDTLDDGNVVSGVGGQYNFVAMAHELAGARSVVLLKSTRREFGKLVSNIILAGGQITSPRHLRDLVVTEYGVADLRAKSDEECVRAMIEIADARFQEELAAAAKKAGKLAEDYLVPARARENTPARVKALCPPDLFPPYPFGSDFTKEEERLVRALGKLRSARLPSILSLFLSGGNAQEFAPELARMGLAAPRTCAEKFWRRLLLGALR